LRIFSLIAEKTALSFSRRDLSEMAQAMTKEPVARSELKTLIQEHGAALTGQLQAHHRNIFPPEAEKTIRAFSPAEVAGLLGIAEGYLRRIAAEHAPAGEETKRAKRFYSVEEIAELRKVLDQGARGSRRYLPHRRAGEHLQVITVMNFKGGSGKTTTSAHLAQWLALHGYRTLAIDLDPQASLSALFGHQPELDVASNETLYGAIRYDEHKRAIAEVVRGTYIPGLHIVPGNLELQEFEYDTPRALLARETSDTMFFARVGAALGEVQDHYDVVVIDCPPQLGYLTLSALTAATAVLITVHPQMLDVMSMSQFLQMTGALLDSVAKAGASTSYDWMKYLITRFEPGDGPQNQMVAFLRSIFGEHVLNHPMLKSTAISDAGLTNQTIFEVERRQFTKSTYDRALDSVNQVNSEIEALIKGAWGRAS
jgi:chromosome partitioning protein